MTILFIAGLVSLIIALVVYRRMAKAFKLMKVRDEIDLTTPYGRLHAKELNQEINLLLGVRYWTWIHKKKGE